MSPSTSAMHRIRAIAAFVSTTCIAATGAANVRTTENGPLAPGPYPVACSDVAYDNARVNQIGGSPADFWEGNPQDGRPRYFTDILLEPLDTIRINPIIVGG